MRDTKLDKNRNRHEDQDIVLYVRDGSDLLENLCEQPSHSLLKQAKETRRFGDKQRAPMVGAVPLLQDDLVSKEPSSTLQRGFFGIAKNVIQNPFEVGQNVV